MIRTQQILPAVLLIGAAPFLHAQIIVPDRLPDGRRMGVVHSPADFGTLRFDTVRTLPEEEGGRNTWWHRHAVYSDGPLQLALDPVLDISSDHRRTSEGAGSTGADSWTSNKGFRNVRGVRYVGNIDDRIDFGGKVLEMQRLLVSPETEYVLQTGYYPAMGTGKLRPTDEGLHKLDHSLAEIWFDVQATGRLNLQWGLGSTGMGPGTRNILWNSARAPAPYLMATLDLGKGWTYRWVQSRRRGHDRLPADGAREGRYRPLGLGIRSIGKSFVRDRGTLDINFMVARWSDVLDRGTHGSTIGDWTRVLLPWTLPNTRDGATPWYESGHQGLDVQWRRERSTWYGQWRHAPFRDERYEGAKKQGPRIMLGHVRHGERCSYWTEWAPVSAETPSPPHPGLRGSSLGIQSWSSLAPWLLQGAEWHIAGCTIAAEVGVTLPDSLRSFGNSWSPDQMGTTFKATLHCPSASQDVTAARNRRQYMPNRWWPALVPVSPFISFMTIQGMEIQAHWWSMGITSYILNRRKTF